MCYLNFNLSFVRIESILWTWGHKKKLAGVFKGMLMDWALESLDCSLLCVIIKKNLQIPAWFEPESGVNCLK